MRVPIRLRRRLATRVPLDMTPLIDIVFQLLIFFILTLRIAPVEGEFAMQLPRTARERSVYSGELPPLIVRLRSDEAGGLAGVWLGDEHLGGWDELHERLAGLVADNPHFTASGRVELHCDRDLAYEHTIAAITAVSGTRQPDGSIVRLIEQVHFAETNEPQTSDF